MSRRFGPDYARDALNAAAATLLPARHRSADGRAEAVNAARRGLHPAVRAALVRHNEGHVPREALAALDDDDVTMVVTGQQVGAGLGPLYSLWKAATAIAWAQRLQREVGTPVLPVFWLQTEDHDVAEIASCVVSDGNGGVHRTAFGADEAARGAIAHRTPDDVDAALTRLDALLTGAPHADAVMEAARAAYRPGARWHVAFTRLLRAAFPGAPLLVLQPRDEAYAKRGIRLHERALAEHVALAELLTARGAALAEAGYDEQVPTREDCALSCFHVGGDTGDRFRLRHDGTRWRLADGHDTDVTPEVRAALRSQPLRFSTTALLRPLWQDTLLPTAAYVGGPGELSYFAQLPPLYEHFEIPMPLILPRASGLLVDAALRDDLAALGLAPRDVDADVDTLLDRLGPPDGVPSFDALDARAKAAIADALTPFRDDAVQVDERLTQAFDKTEEAMLRCVSKLQARIERSARRADPERVAAVRRVVARLRPDGTPQDRSLCWLDVAARAGTDAVGVRLLDAVARAVEHDDDTNDLVVDL